MEVTAWSLLLFCTTSYYGGHVFGQPSAIVPQHIRRVVNETNVTVPCRTPPNTDVRWKVNGHVLPEFGNADYRPTRTSSSQNELVIFRLRDEHSGNYTCIIVANPTAPADVAVVTVLTPPTSVEIVGYPRKSVIDVAFGVSSFNLTCRVSGAKPPATLLWLKRDEPIEHDAGQASVAQIGSTYITTRELSLLQPRRELNKIPFTCLVQHEALNLRQRSMNVTFNFSVHYPPGNPQISDYDNLVKRPGDLLAATCQSYGGNPQPVVHWYRNGLPFFLTYTSNEERMLVSSKLSVIINSSDNDAVYRCEVSNSATPTPLTAEIKLSVKFPPSSVKITGHEKAKAGDRVTLTCTSANSNPAATIMWLSRAQVITSGRTFEVMPSVNSGYTSISNITVNLTREDNNAEYICQATNTDLGQTVTDRVQLEVHYPPNRPTISGYNESTHVLYGSVQRMTCTTIGGRPIPELAWSKESAAITSIAKAAPHPDIAMREVEFITKPDDNNARYTCSATSAAIDAALTVSIIMRVYFPPQNVTLRYDPDPIRAGHLVKFFCDSGSSNPSSEITWRKNGELVAGQSTSSRPAAYSGRATVSRYEMMAQASDNGVLIECKAMNNHIHEATSEGRTLSVHHAPIYADGKYTKKVSVEVDGTVAANFTPVAKPVPSEYNWYKGAEKLVLGAKPARARRDITKLNFYADGGAITFVNVTKADAGIYRVEAKNDEGTGSYEFTLDVHYAAAFVGPIQQTDLGNGGVKLTCEADANPVTDSMVKFTGRAGYDMAARTSQAYQNKKAELTIASVVKDDLGEFTCTAGNGIGVAAVQTISLLVPIAPTVDKSPQYSKAAARNGEGSVKCIIIAYPRPTVSWKHKDVLLDETTGKYTMTIKDGSDRFTFEAVLTVSNVTKLDYGSYKCTAVTPRDRDVGEVLLEGTSKPDPPYNLQVLNTTSNSIKLAWSRGFNGGLEEHFRIRYKVSDSATKGHTYKDAYDSPFEVQGLNPATMYELTVSAENVLGQSDYVSPGVTARTLVDLSVKPVVAKEDDATLIIILSVAIVGVLFFILNAFLIVVFVRRRRKQKQLIDESASQANTLELYGTQTGSVANGFDDGKSYTTYEKSIDYSEDCLKHYEDDSDEDEGDDEAVREHPRYAPAPGTYLVDEPLPPPHPWTGPPVMPSGAYFPHSDDFGGDTSNMTTSPNYYAEKLRAAGRKMPYNKDSTLQRSSYGAAASGFEAQRPLSRLSYHAADSDAPAIPERNYSPQIGDSRLLSQDHRFQIADQDRSAAEWQVNGMPGQYI